MELGIVRWLKSLIKRAEVKTETKDGRVKITIECSEELAKEILKQPDKPYWEQ